MTFKPPLLFAAALAAFVPARGVDNQLLNTWEKSSFSLLPRSFQKDPHLNVMIVTEFTAAGRQAPQASPGHPIYYLGSSSDKMETAGDVVAGELDPGKAALDKVLTRTLASGGYLPASKAHPPTIFIYYRWGSYNKFSAIDGSDPGASPEDDTQVRNLFERAILVGGTKFAVEMARAYNAGTQHFFWNKSDRNVFLEGQVYSNRYFVMATAYDFAAVKEGGKVILWRTDISTDSQGITMNESVPGLIAVSGPYFGHETDGPVRLNRAVVQEGRVDVGTPIVKQDLPSDAPRNPPPDEAPSAASGSEP